LPSVLQLVLAGQQHALTLLQDPTHHYQVQSAGGPCDVQLHALQLNALEDHHSLHGEVDFSLHRFRQHAVFVREGECLWLHWQGQAWQVQEQTRTASLMSALSVAVGEQVAASRVVAEIEMNSERQT
jgi:hypothetical protein